MVDKINEGLSKYEIRRYGEGYIRMDRNENLVLPADLAKEIVSNAVIKVDVRSYPDEQKLVKMLSKFLGVGEGELVIGNGGDDILYKLLLAFGRESKVILNAPSYSMYQWFVDRVGGKVINIYLNRDFTLDVDRIVESARDDVDLIIVCNPNNPTGNLFDIESILYVTENVNSIVVVDETYSVYSKVSLLEYVDSYENLVVVGSYSKIGFAGIRFGYAVANEKLMNFLIQLFPPYNVNAMTLAVVEVIINRYREIMKYVEKVVVERERLIREINNLKGLYAYPSNANFILIKLLNGNVSELIEYFMEKGIVVRDVSDQPLLENCFRVTVLDNETNNLFLSYLRGFVEG